MDENFETFGTEIEALAFVKGMEAAIECSDTDHVQIGRPKHNRKTGEWTVTYGYFC